MARQKTRKQLEKEARREQRWLEQSARDFEFHNGGGTEPYRIKCESCGLVQHGGEQYHNPRLQITPCACGGILALYEPQLR